MSIFKAFFPLFLSFSIFQARKSKIERRQEDDKNTLSDTKYEPFLHKKNGTQM